MKIGIFVHSNTGNTYSVAEKLKDKLTTEGHTVEIKKLEPVGGEDVNVSDLNKINFNPKPDASGFDSVIFAAPVRAFSISPVLASYLGKLDTLKGQKVDLFVTQHLSYPWLGGNHAISQMKKLCEAKGAVVGNTGIINWKNKNREKMIAEVVEKLGKK